ncbi:malectin domain-containing carbohydrate-binding protein [Lunatibacter salilacus]|uniref:malectin domain-containing carbohydrate-binding protein n=1 Tax=Lunatibacter salilacus TaxID=2483804 RepID=UPI00131AF64E|nr:malectin domain-containing carbohydrate-binding protein [Lunatibacter salilacus]
MKRVGRKFGMIIVAILISHLTYAADYYISSSIGDDKRTALQAQNPETPWKSIEKVNAVFSTLKPGDGVFFKRGDSFYGTIHLTASGVMGSPIRLDAYGVGEEPIITSFQKISQWTSKGNGVFESQSILNTNLVKTLLVDGESHFMGRFPNADAINEGYLRISGISGGKTLSSAQLSASPNWAGGDVVIRKNQWIIDTHKISSHNGNSVTYTGNESYPSIKDYGFFIQNHISTLDRFGEWYFNPTSKKMSMFFGNVSPNGRNIEVSTLNNLVTKSYGASYITFQNLILKGSNSDVVDISGGRDIKFNKVKIKFAGESGIYVRSVVNLSFENSYVENCLNNGINLRYGNPNASIKNNIVKNSARFPGGVRNGDGSGNGIIALDDNTIIEGNEVYNTGYLGIQFGGNNTIVKNNFIDNFCLIKGDGGGIYTYVGDNNKTFHNRKIVSNIIINGKGNLGGLPNNSSYPRGMAEGIFMDDNANGIEISNNTIGHTENSGVKMSNVRNIIVKDNLIYDTDHSITLDNNIRGADVKNVTMSNNTYFAKTNLQNSYTFLSHKNDVKEMGAFDNNVFFRPFGDPYSIFTRQLVNGTNVETRQNLSSFKNMFGKDNNSKSNENVFPKYENIVVKGENFFKNGQFNGSLNDIHFTRAQPSVIPNKINGPTLQIVANDNAFSFIKLGNLKKEKKYLIRLNSSASQNAAISVHFRHSGSPWHLISPISTFDLTSSTAIYQTILSPLLDVADAALILTFKNPNTTYWIDDLEIVEVEANEVRIDEKILFEFNATNQSKKVLLQGKYVDAKLKEFTGEVTLAPYSGIALFKTGDVEKPVEKNKPEDPEIVISLNKSIDKITTKDSVQISLGIANNQNAGMTSATFYCGLNEIGKCNTYPFNINWKNLQPGEQYIWASLNDGNGRTFNSEEINLNITQAKTTEDTERNYKEPHVGFGDLKFKSEGIYINTGSTRDAIYNSVNFASEYVNKNYSGGFTESFDAPNIEPIFKSQRFAKLLVYDIPLKNGTYNIVTFHNEVYFGNKVATTGPNKRVYNISIEDKLVKKDFDLFVENNNKPISLLFKDIKVIDGNLTLKLESIIGHAAISGIAIIPVDTNIPPVVDNTKSLPKNGIYINAGSNKDVDFQGTKFESDFQNSHFNGGFFESHALASDQELFQSQRFSKNLVYDVPVSNGKYTVITYHNEVYFGNRVPAKGPGLRVFDIFIEGKLVKKNLDLFVENKSKQFELIFENVEVNDGKVTINLVSSVADAAISGIAILPESTNDGDDQVKETISKEAIHINTGNSRSGEYKGIQFESEFTGKYYNTGYIEGIASASIHTMMQSQRFAKDLVYEIPVKNGKYNVVTYHNEVYFGQKVSTTGPNKRVYSISIQDKEVKKNFDLFVVNNNKEIALEHKDIEVKNGLMKIRLLAVIGHAAISGISIIPVDANIPPVVDNTLPKNGVYINAGSNNDADFHGTKFESDFQNRHFNGSFFESHVSASDQELFQSQRFAKNLVYDVPVSNGKYTVITYHNEVYFGNRVAATGPGRRVFDIFIEGKLVKKNLDLFVENNSKQFELIFENIEVKDGKMTINLVSSVADAAISGIAIFPSNEKFSPEMANLRQLNGELTDPESESLNFGNFKDAKAKLFPNPASSQVNLVLDSEYPNSRIMIHDTSGQLVRFYNQSEIYFNNGTLSIPLLDLKQGVYIVSVVSERGVQFKEKLMVTK